MRSRARVSRLSSLVPLFALACSSKPAAVVAPTPAPPVVAPRVVAETVTVRDAELERRLARVELSLWERDAQIAVLNTRLEEARQEIVRAMARMQTLASRAEAASSMAEADVAIQALGLESEADARQARQLIGESSVEFDKQNYAGALYLANAAKTAAAQSRLRLGAVDRASLRQGEVLFATTIQLAASSRGNIREGPGTGFPVVFTAEPGTDLTAVSYLGEWVRVSDNEGRSGWIARTLVNPKNGSR